MKKIFSSIIYENPLPQLRSRQAAFPWLCQLKDNTIIASFAIGEAFESVDSTSYIAKSYDGGKTWSEPVQMFDKSKMAVPISDYCKITAIENDKIVALGYAYKRENPDLPIGNPQTGGLLDDFVFYSISNDNGESFGEMQVISTKWGPHVEASAPVTVLKNGNWATPITCFPDWDGNKPGKTCGKLLITADNGKTWDDSSVCMDFGKDVTCYEQRLCQLDSGTIVCIGWNEDLNTGEALANHFTYSVDNGKNWSAPVSTGIMGQASSVCSLGGEKFLALHAIRRNTDRPGIYAYVIDFSDKQWNIIESEIIWEPTTPIVKDTKMAEVFSYLKFGQPGAIKLNDNSILMSHWYADNGQYKTIATKIEIDME